MKKRACLIFLLLASFSVVCSCAHNEEEPNYETIIYPDGTEERVMSPSIDAVTKNNMLVSILPPEWMDFYKKQNDYLSIKKFYEAGTEKTAPRVVTLRWSHTESCTFYTVKISDNKKMDNPLLLETTTKYVELNDLYADTHYYYQINAHFDDKIVVSRKFDFRTYDFFRTINIYGVYNARDIGNKKTIDGRKRVKQGIVYRSANFDSVSSLGITKAKDSYHIKTDLDLREQGPTSSPLGEGINYINNGTSDYGSPIYVDLFHGIVVEEYQEVLKNNLKVFTNSNNFPLVFHCAVGRDRTGTLAITLYLLLGVRLDQIVLDHVVSFFSKAANTVDFDDYDVLMNRLIAYYTNYKGRDGTAKGTIHQKVERFCLDIGLSKNEIDSIRSNLLEDI